MLLSLHTTRIIPTVLSRKCVAQEIVVVFITSMIDKHKLLVDAKSDIII